MFGIARSLVWKEWREQRWRTLVVTGIVLFIATWFSFGGQIAFSEGAIPALYTVLPFAAMFLAMSAAASEQSARTIGFLQALPISPAKFGITKLISSLLALMAPVAFICGILFLLEKSSFSLPDNEIAPWSIATTWPLAILLVAAGVTSLFLWATVCGVNQSDEIQAGAIGFLGIAGVWAALILIPLAFVEDPDVLPGWRLLVAGAPGGPIAVISFPEQGPWWSVYGPFFVWSFAVHSVLAGCFVMRYGRIARAAVKPAVTGMSAVQVTSDWLAPPRRTPLSALIWKQMRESAPLATLGAALIVLVSAIIRRYAGSDNEFDESAYIAAWHMIASFLMLVAGIGAFMEDYHVGVDGFWRSRPIPMKTYFAIKYFGGLAATTAILLFALLLTLGLSSIWNPLEWRDVKNLYSYPLVLLVIQWAIYTGSVTAFVVTRNALAAAVLAIISVILVSIAIGYAGSYLPQSWITFGVLSVTPILAAATLAYYAFRNDWGWRK